MNLKMLLATAAAAMVCLAAQAQNNQAVITQTSTSPTSAVATISCSGADSYAGYNVDMVLTTSGSDWTSITFTFWDGTVKTLLPGRNDVPISLRTPSGSSTNTVKIQVNGSPSAKPNGGQILVMNILPPNGANTTLTGSRLIKTSLY
ncbi:MAG: hypothetical protein IJC16_10280 [Rikenellaceae bacterium]|nr:hypothetical protein [Rikenellaceae bacterium]